MFEPVSRQNLPQDIIRILATHGPLDVVTATLDGGGRVVCAPFEDTIYLFVSPGSSIETGLIRTSRLNISATAQDGSYAIRMEGRAHAGTPLARHELRSSIEPWAPEGVAQQRLLVVPFVAEDVEFVKGRDEVATRYAGLTPAGRHRPSASAIWLRAAFSGVTGVLAVLFIVGLIIWFIQRGESFQGRSVAMFFSLVTGLGLLSGARLLVIAWGFDLWRKHRASSADAPCLVEGLMAPGQARITAAAALLAAAIALVPLGTIWGGQFAMGIVLASGVWLAVPAWVIHLALGRPDPHR